MDGALIFTCICENSSRTVLGHHRSFTPPRYGTAKPFELICTMESKLRENVQLWAGCNADQQCMLTCYMLCTVHVHPPPPRFPLLSGESNNWSKATPTVSHKTTSMRGMQEHTYFTQHTAHTHAHTFIYIINSSHHSARHGQ